MSERRFESMADSYVSDLYLDIMYKECYETDNDICCACDHPSDRCVGCNYFSKFRMEGVEYP